MSHSHRYKKPTMVNEQGAIAAIRIWLDLTENADLKRHFKTAEAIWNLLGDPKTKTAVDVYNEKRFVKTEIGNGKSAQLEFRRICYDLEDGVNDVEYRNFIQNMAAKLREHLLKMENHFLRAQLQESFSNAHNGGLPPDGRLSLSHDNPRLTSPLPSPNLLDELYFFSDSPPLLHTNSSSSSSFIRGTLADSSQLEGSSPPSSPPPRPSSSAAAAPAQTANSHVIAPTPRRESLKRHIILSNDGVRGSSRIRGDASEGIGKF